MKDRIIQEVWNVKDTIAAEHDHDMKRLVESLREKEKASGARVVDLHALRQAESRTR